MRLKADASRVLHIQRAVLKGDGQKETSPGKSMQLTSPISSEWRDAFEDDTASIVRGCRVWSYLMCSIALILIVGRCLVLSDYDSSYIVGVFFSWSIVATVEGLTLLRTGTVSREDVVACYVVYEVILLIVMSSIHVVLSIVVENVVSA